MNRFSSAIVSRAAMLPTPASGSSVRALFLRSQPVVVSTFNFRRNFSAVTSQLIMQLRQETGAGMMDCKKALIASEADLQAAKEWLRKKGVEMSGSKADRVAREGVVSVIVNDNQVAVVEVNCETDFVARSGKFQETVSKVTSIFASSDISPDSLLAHKPTDSPSIEELFAECTNAIREKVALGRVKRITTSHANEAVSAYVHNCLAPGTGRVAAVVVLGFDEQGASKKEEIKAVAKQLALQIVAGRPKFLSPEFVPEAVLLKEREIFTEQVEKSGKPAAIAKKIVDNQVKNYLKTNCLTEQEYLVGDEGQPSMSVRQYIKNASEELAVPLTIKAFERIQVGQQ